MAQISQMNNDLQNLFSMLSEDIIIYEEITKKVIMISKEFKRLLNAPPTTSIMECHLLAIYLQWVVNACDCNCGEGNEKEEIKEKL